MNAFRDRGVWLRRRSLRAALVSSGALAAALSLGPAVSAAAPARVSSSPAAAAWPNGGDLCQIPCGTLPDDGIRGLMSLMSVPEEDTLAHLGGARVNGNAGSVAPVPRLGIPVWNWTDGPAGVGLGAPDTAMPAGAGLTAPWSPDMANLFGQAVGLDARAPGQGGVYAPSVNQSACLT